MRPSLAGSSFPDRPGLHRHDRRRAYSAGHRMRSGGRRRDAFRETSWTPLHIRYSLFLVLARAIRLGNLSCRHALERKLPLVHSRRPFIRVRLDWPFGNSTALAILGEVAHNRAGPFLRLDAYVDNGKQLPVWKDLPHAMYWLLPSLIAAPPLIRALLHHPVVRASRGL